ncbi:lasso peptide isopeptide bond-forming cyclase [Cytobacillus firmus]|nr:lasso peptide isopeptide bond-forming cyclase [Cytobacillus firmus]
MSAIAGIYNLNGEPVSIEQSSGMMKAFEKFPADDIQTWHKENLFLGCHAQWITPESIGEQLPFYDYQRQLAITADAIIDNREELFERLQIDREDQKKITDSQLILLAYHKWGEESPKFLVGDFAFMIWDEKERKMFGARDFSGARTLYYYRDNQRFGFSTTIQPLFSLHGVRKELNEEWLAEFLAIPGVIDTVDATLTPYKNIKQIPPSHCIKIVEGRIDFVRYCTFTQVEKLRFKSNDDYIEAFREVFQKAVKEQSRTHLKIGARLSGGLDSGSVVSFASKSLMEKKKRLHTYSYVPVKDFKDWTPKSRIANERPYIESTVKYVGNITDNYLDFEGKNSFSEIDSWLEILEMPYKFTENSFWLKGIYERAQQDGIGILLNGSRGNYTISWGPAIDYYASLLRKLKWFRLNKELFLYSINKGSGRKHMLSIVGRRAFPIIDKFLPKNSEHATPLLINPEFANRSDVFNTLQMKGIHLNSTSPLNMYEMRKRHFEQSFSWNLNGTSKGKASLKYSLWDRDPTNDLRVIKYCLSVPEEQFVQNGLDRALIRRATETFLPDNIRLNQRVRGLQSADGLHRMIPTWNLFLEEIKQIINNPRVSDYLNIKVINNAFSEMKEDPRGEYVYDANFKILMRSIIVNRFLMTFS